MNVRVTFIGIPPRWGGTKYVMAAFSFSGDLYPYARLRDRFVKFHLYQKAGVREYWIVDPDSKTIAVNILDNGKYYITAYAETDTDSVYVLEGCIIDYANVFTE